MVKTQGMKNSMARQALSELLFTSDSSGQLWNTCVWDLSTATVEHTFKGGVSASKTACLIGSDYYLTAERDKPILHYWPICKKESKQVKIFLPGAPTAVTITPDSNYCIVAIAEKTYIYQLRTGRLLSINAEHYQPIRCIAVTSDSSHLITGGDDSLIHCWHMSSLIDQTRQVDPDPIFTWSDHSLSVTHLTVSRLGSKARLISTSLDQSCRVFDLTTGQLIAEYLFDVGLSTVCLSSNQSRLFVGTVSGHIYRVDLHAKVTEKVNHISDKSDSLLSNGQSSVTNFRRFTGHTKEVTCLAVSLDETTLASGSKDMSVKIWHVPSCQCIRTLPHKGAVTNLLITRRLSQLFSDKFHPTHTITTFSKHKYIQSEDQHGNLELPPIADRLTNAFTTDMAGDFEFCLSRASQLYKLSDADRNRCVIDKALTGSDHSSEEMDQLKQKLEANKAELNKALSANKELYNHSLKLQLSKMSS